VQLNKQMHRKKGVNLHRHMIKQTYRVTHTERDFYNELTPFDGGTFNKNLMIFIINSYGYMLLRMRNKSEKISSLKWYSLRVSIDNISHNSCLPELDFLFLGL